MLKKPDTNLVNKYITQNKWVLSAINLDEDIHFSSYYLRMSLNHMIQESVCGYSKIVALYENYNEYYWLLKDECVFCAKELVDRMMTDPEWFDKILIITKKKAEFLGSLFNPTQFNHAVLSKLDNYSILDLYKKQYNASLDLYRYARIPEMLDRGVMFFSNFLFEFLRNSLGKFDVSEEFFALTHSDEQSIFGKERRDFENLALRLKAEIHPSYRDTKLHLSTFARNEIQTYLNEWRYINYHGYEHNKLETIDDVISKLVIYFCNKNSGQINNAGISSADLRKTKQRVINMTKMPTCYLRLYTWFPQIALVKLYRKYYQIKNFYYLDCLIDEISIRLNKSEAFVRSMLPNEIMSYLAEGKIDIPAIENRIKSSLYVLDKDGEMIITDSNYINYIHTILTDTQNSCFPANSGGKINGYPASKGIATGRCVWINRKSDKIDFFDGDIILSDSADPDIFDYIIRAGALVTVQGGVTSHAAIFCRENGIPAVIRAQGIEYIKSGEILRVNGNSGTVEVVDVKKANINIDIDMHSYGMKADNLTYLNKLGYNVPRFYLLDFSLLNEYYTNGKINVLLEQLVNYFNLEDNHNTLIIRSSALDEDKKHNSAVGKYHSVPNVTKMNLLNKLSEFIRINQPLNYSGGVIVQEMCPFDYCGVVISGNVRFDNSDLMTIEICKGATNFITEGINNYCRIEYSKKRQEVVSIYDPTHINMHSSILMNLIVVINRLLSEYDTEIDVEWGVLKEKIYLLQVRPVAHSVSSR